MKTENFNRRHCLYSLLMTSFCFIDSLIFNFADEKMKRNIYGTLSKVYLLDGDELAVKLGEIALRRDFSHINSQGEHNRIRRMLEYSRRNGGNFEFSEEEMFILDCKRTALADKKEFFGDSDMSSPEMLMAMLEDRAAEGYVRAANTLAFLELSEIISSAISRDEALSYLRRSAAWNSGAAILTGLFYDTDKREAYINKAAVCFQGSLSEIFMLISRIYGTDKNINADEAAAVLEKAFDAGNIKRSRIVLSVLDILSCKIYGKDAIEKLVMQYSPQNGRLPELSCDVFSDTEPRPDLSVLDKIPERFLRERETVKLNLSSCDMRRDKGYKPLLIICRDRYTLSVFRDTIAEAFPEKRRFVSDGAFLSQAELSYTSENLFVRAASDTHEAGTVVIIDNCDEMRDDYQAELAGMLPGIRRERFRLVRPAVTLSLSSALPVLFAKARPSEALCRECECIYPVQRPDGSKPDAIRRMFEEKKSAYSTPDISISEEASGRLIQLPLEKAEPIMDIAFRMVRLSGEKEISDTLIDSASKLIFQAQSRCLGFTGGNENV